MTYNYASVLVSTLQRHEYYYGENVEDIEKITEKAREEIVNHRVEKVNLRRFASKDKMLDYIEVVQALYDEAGVEPSIYVV